MSGPQDDYTNICPKCGAFYVHFCVHCEKAGMEERVWELMNRHGLKEDELIRVLAEQVFDGKFPALNLAITLRGLKPADKHEVDVTEGVKLNDAKERFAAVLAKLAGRKRAERVPE